MLGRFDEARTIAHTAGSRLREVTGHAGGQMVLAEVAAMSGDHESAAHYFKAHCDLLQEAALPGYLSTYAPKLGRSLCVLGRHDEAEPLAQLGRELGGEQDASAQMLWRQVQALVHADRGEHAEAEPLAREAVTIAEETDALNWQGDALCGLAQVLQTAGRSDEAAATLQQALERYERKRNVAMAAQVRARLAAITGANTGAQPP